MRTTPRPGSPWQYAADRHRSTMRIPVRQVEANIDERREKRTIPESVAASRWREEVFEPTVAAVPENLWAALPAAELFHQVLEHRWFLSEQAGKDVGIDEAVKAYVASELPKRRPERVVLEET